MKQSEGLHNQLAPKKKNNPKLHKALLVINCVLFFLCSCDRYLVYTSSGTSDKYSDVSACCSDGF